MKKHLIFFAFILFSFNINAEISQSGITNLKQLDKNGIIDLVNGNQLTGYISDGPFEGPITQTYFKNGTYETVYENKTYKGKWRAEGESYAQPNAKRMCTQNNNAKNESCFYWYTGTKDGGTYAFIAARGKLFHQYHELKSVEQVKAEEKKKAEKKKKAAELKRIADAKKAEEKKKAAELKRIADAKKAERIAQEKLAEEKKAAEQRRVREEKRIAKENKKLALLPPKTKLQEAQEFLSDIQDFIKSNPDEFDFFEIVKFTKNTKLISEGISDDEQLKTVELYKAFVESSTSFVEFQNNSQNKRVKRELAKVDELIDSVNVYFYKLKAFQKGVDYGSNDLTESKSMYRKENLSSTSSNLLDEKIKTLQLIITNPTTFAELENTKEDLNLFLFDLRREVEKTIFTRNENKKISKEFNVELLKIDENINNLKTYYVENIDTISDDLTDLILEHVSLLQNVKKSINLDNKKEGLEELLKVNEETSSFKLDNNLLTSYEVAAIKKAAQDKKKVEADRKRAADKKKADKKKADEKRKADAKEAKRLKNFKTVRMTCYFDRFEPIGEAQQKWVYDGKTVTLNGERLSLGSIVNQGYGKMKLDKLPDLDSFEAKYYGQHIEGITTGSKIKIGGYTYQLAHTFHVNFDNQTSLLIFGRWRDSVDCW